MAIDDPLPIPTFRIVPAPGWLECSCSRCGCVKDVRVVLWPTDGIVPCPECGDGFLLRRDV